MPPWAGDEPGAIQDPLLQVLRGDFFTLPFGSNSTPYDGEHHPFHGETAQARWTLEERHRRRAAPEPADHDPAGPGRQADPAAGRASGDLPAAHDLAAWPGRWRSGIT